METVTLEESETCVICGLKFKHAEFVFSGFSPEDKDVKLHPNCVSQSVSGKVKAVNSLLVHLEKDKAISSAKQVVLKKRYKEIMKAVEAAKLAKDSR